jgi:hypothetical protein
MNQSQKIVIFEDGHAEFQANIDGMRPSISAQSLGRAIFSDSVGITLGCEMENVGNVLVAGLGIIIARNMIAIALPSTGHPMVVVHTGSRRDRAIANQGNCTITKY